MDAGLLHGIQTYGQKFSNNPNEKFLLMILCSQAKLENDNKSINVKRGLRTRAEMGLLPGYAPIGYLNDLRSDHKCEYLVDPLRAPVVKMIFEKIAVEKWSGLRIYSWLKNEMNFKTRNDKHLNISSLYEMLKNPFYCGVYEYPRKSGNWFVGKHQSLISQEIFRAVRGKILEETKPRKRNGEFTFVKMMICGKCGSGVTGLEKQKILKADGSTRWYTYYSCTKAKDRNCKNTYIREDSLIAQLCEKVDELEIDRLGAKCLLEKEVTRYNRLRKTVLGVKEKDTAAAMDIKRYAKYLLEEGSMEEKRGLLEHLRGRIVINDKKVFLEK